MSEIHCRRCGEIWDYYYITHEMPPSERTVIMKGDGCPKCRNCEVPEEGERDLALASIIESLNEITRHYAALDTLLEHRLKKYILPENEVFIILEQLFISCQVAEQRIKIAMKRGYINEMQLNLLNHEIRGVVQKMIALSTHSPLITHIITQLAETKPVVMGILRSFTSPSQYGRFQFLVRKHEPADNQSIYRISWEKGV